jgi:hypothetical protein
MITHKGLLHLGFSKDDFLLQDDSDGKGVYVKEWNSDKPQPSAEEMKKANDFVKAQEYIYKRKESYPPMEDYLDGIVKGDQAQIDKYVSDCLAIKEKFPKE